MAIPINQINAGDIVTTKEPRKFHIRRNFTPEDLITLTETHYARSVNYDILYDYYKGNHWAIQQRYFKDENKPNNKVIHNFPKLVVDTSVAYLVGEPITYAGDEATIEAMKPVFKNNFIDDLNTEEAKFASIFGHCFEIAWIDKNGDLRFKAVSPKNCFIVYSMDLDEEPLAAVYYNQFTDEAGGQFTRVYEVFTKDYKLVFTTETREDPKTKERVAKMKGFEKFPNALHEFPVYELVANEERLGDFEAQISLIDAYNLAVSDSVNDIAYWNDAYLWLQGFDISDDGNAVAEMKNNRVIVTDENGEVKFVTKEINDKHIENIKDRARDDIFSLSQTPDLASPQFAAASGVAMRAKSQPLENKTAMKESKFKKLLLHRFQIIKQYLVSKKEAGAKNLKPEEVEPVFVRNLPQSYSELADMAVKLKDTMPDETILAQFPFITDPAEQVKKANKQRADRIKQSAMGFEVPKLGATGLATAATNGGQAATATNPTGASKLNNDASKNQGIDTDDPNAAKAQEKARNKKPLNQPKAK